MDEKPEVSQEQDALLADLRHLVDEAQRLASAEAAYRGAQVKLIGAAAGRISGLAVAGLIFASLALIALVVGLVIALGPVLGAWGALGAVVGALVLLATACGLLGGLTWRRVKKLLTEDAA